MGMAGHGGSLSLILFIETGGIMKKSVICCAAVLVVFLSVICLSPGKSLADTTDNYFVLRGGLAMPQDMDINASGGGSGSTMSFENGYTVSVAYGRRILPWLRGEIEIGWNAMDADKLQLHNRKTEIDDNGKDEHLYGMLNALADWRNDSAFTPYIGLGVGVANATLENTFVWPGNGNQVSRDSSDTAFAWQFMLGVLWDINSSWGMELRGRYFGSDDRIHDNHAAGTNVNLDVDGSRIWLLDFGVCYKF